MENKERQETVKKFEDTEKFQFCIRGITEWKSMSYAITTYKFFMGAQPLLNV